MRMRTRGPPAALLRCLTSYNARWRSCSSVSLFDLSFPFLPLLFLACAFPSVIQLFYNSFQFQPLTVEYNSNFLSIPCSNAQTHPTSNTKLSAILLLHTLFRFFMSVELDEYNAKRCASLLIDLWFERLDGSVYTEMTADLLVGRQWGDVGDKNGCWRWRAR